MSSEATVKRWLILRTDGLEDIGEGQRIPVAHMPTYLHTEREAAERELLRLESAQGHGFSLFEAVGYARHVSAYSGGKFIEAHVLETIA
jgi:hypothetical protein